VIFVEKKALESKKFRFALLTLIALTGIIITGLISQTFGWPMAAFMAIAVAGLVTISMGYVLGQASIDKWANIIGHLGKIGPKGEKNDTESEEGMGGI
jgi:hypothetical protein